MTYANSKGYETTEAIVSGESEIKETQWGHKARLDFSLPSGKTVMVWDGLDENDDSPLLTLAIGQAVNLYQNDNGNFKLDKKALTAAAAKTTKKTKAKTLAIATEPTAAAAGDPTLAITNDDNPIRKQARILKDCVDAVLIEFHGIGLTDEVIQKYATSLFISLTKTN